jgi:hypothetical protein
MKNALKPVHLRPLPLLLKDTILANRFDLKQSNSLTPFPVANLGISPSAFHLFFPKVTSILY